MGQGFRLRPARPHYLRPPPRAQGARPRELATPPGSAATLGVPAGPRRFSVNAPRAREGASIVGIGSCRTNGLTSHIRHPTSDIRHLNNPPCPPPPPASSSLTPRAP